MPTFQNVPCVICGEKFSWQNDSNPNTRRICCQACEQRAADARMVAKCRWCGENETYRARPDKVEFVRKHYDTCHKCSFWLNLLVTPDQNRIITPDYEHKIAAGWGITTPADRWSGYGGACWVVIFNDGTKKYTNDLWAQGTIPEIWRPHFPPNVKTLMHISRKDIPTEELTNV